VPAKKESICKLQSKAVCSRFSEMKGGNLGQLNSYSAQCELSNGLQLLFNACNLSEKTGNSQQLINCSPDMSQTCRPERRAKTIRGLKHARVCKALQVQTSVGAVGWNVHGSGASSLVQPHPNCLSLRPGLGLLLHTKPESHSLQFMLPQEAWLAGCKASCVAGNQEKTYCWRLCGL